MLPPHSGKRSPHWLYCLLAAWLTLPAGSLCHAATGTDTAWKAALSLDYNSAAANLEQQHRANPADARIATAYAASLLVRDPVTTVNVTEAETLLGNLLKTLPPDDVEYRPLVLYLLGRIAHDHAEPPRLADAQSRYEQLRRDYPGHPLADQAAVHLGYIVSLQAAPSDAREGIAAVETLLASATSPDARRELHYLLAHLHWHGRHDAAAALPHYLAGREIGFEAPYRNGEVDLTIAGLAVELDRNELAARHYLAFAAAYPQDGRAKTARRLAVEAQARDAQIP
ncbi:MAG: hypothetical protein IT582_11040 [Opitutaceae bacterium]|nr:hypothetical protein [Opitutaceae bacterium]